MVKNAAKLAVYDEISIKVKNHQALPTIRPEIDLFHKHYKDVKKCQTGARRCNQGLILSQ